MTADYTAESIKIRHEAVHSWEVVASLVDRYPFRPVEWIERGLQACELAGVGFDYFIARYLERDGITPMNPVVNECMIEILRGWRDGAG